MADYNIARLKILIIESNALTAKAIKNALCQLGVLEVFCAANIEDALETLATTELDLILSDWSPQMNGLQLLQRVRNDHSKSNPYIPVIFLSAFSDSEQRKEAINAGINDFLTKPFTARRIYNHIKRTIEVPSFFLRSGRYFGPCRRLANKPYDNTPLLNSEIYAGDERRFHKVPMEDDALAYRQFNQTDR